MKDVLYEPLNNFKLSKLILRILIKSNGFIYPIKIPNGVTKIIVDKLTEVVSELTKVFSELTKVFCELTEVVGALPSASWPVMSAR